jgi:hypothetical protein
VPWGFELAHALLDHAVHDFIGHQFAALHVRARQRAQCAGTLKILTEQIAGRNVPQIVTRAQLVGVRAFAGARRPEENNVHVIPLSSKAGPRRCRVNLRDGEKRGRLAALCMVVIPWHGLGHVCRYDPSAF